MSCITDSTITSPHLIPVTEWVNHYAYPPIGQLRALIFNAKANGFERCIRRIGRRVLISVPDFFAWVDQKNGITTTLQNGGSYDK